MLCLFLSTFSLLFICHPGFGRCCCSAVWMSSWNDAIWLPSSPSSMVSMATVSNDWGRGSNWPIVSKLHFSEWFPLSCYWNRAPALWWIHLVIHSLEGKRGKYKHDTRGLASLKQSSYWMNKHTSARTVKQQFERGGKNTHTHTVASMPQPLFWPHLLTDCVVYF